MSIGSTGFKIVYLPGPGKPLDKPLLFPTLNLELKVGDFMDCDLQLAMTIVSAARDVFLVCPDGSKIQYPHRDLEFLKKHKLPMPDNYIEEALFRDPKTGKLINPKEVK